jgi:hypothetical protein
MLRWFKSLRPVSSAARQGRKSRTTLYAEPLEERSLPSASAPFDTAGLSGSDLLSDPIFATGTDSRKAHGPATDASVSAKPMLGGQANTGQSDSATTSGSQAPVPDVSTPSAPTVVSSAGAAPVSPASSLSGSLAANTTTELFSFAGIDNANANQDSSGTLDLPPNTQLAVGYQFVVEAINQTVAIFNKSTGAQVSNTSFTSFFGRGGVNHTLLNPTASFDRATGRFYIGIENVTASAGPTQPSEFDLAVSKTSDPTQGFTIHTVDLTETNLSVGATSLGWNNDALVTATDMYDNTGTFTQTQIHVINKATLLNTGTVSASKLDRTGLLLRPSTMAGSAPGDPMWFIGEASGPGATPTLEVSALTNLLTPTPAFQDHTVSVPTYNAISNADAPQDPGGNVTDPGVLNTTFTQTAALQVVNGVPTLAATHMVGGTSVTQARWYEISLGGSSPSLLDSGDITPGAGISTFIPSIAIDINGTLGLTYMQSSSTQTVSMYVNTRNATDPAGTLQTPIEVQAGQANANWFESFFGVKDAGEMSGMAIDPTNGTFWAANAFANNAAAPNWGTFIANFSLSRHGVFFTDANNLLWMYDAATMQFKSTGGYAVALSAGIDGQGNPECFFTDANNQLWRYDNGTFSFTGGYATRISAGRGLVAFTDANNQLWIFSDQNGFKFTGGYAAIFSTGYDVVGNTQISFLDANNLLWLYNLNTNSFTDTGGFAIRVSQGRDAQGNNETNFLDGANRIYIYSQPNFTFTGGFAQPSSLSGSQGVLYFLDGNNQMWSYQDATGSFMETPGFALQISSNVDMNALFFRDGVNELWFFHNGLFTFTGGFARGLSAF